MASVEVRRSGGAWVGASWTVRLAELPLPEATALFQAAQFTLHAYYLVTEMPRDRLYSIINNVDTVGVLVCILTGTLVAWRRRSRLQAA